MLRVAYVSCQPPFSPMCRGNRSNGPDWLAMGRGARLCVFLERRSAAWRLQLLVLERNIHFEAGLGSALSDMF